MKKHIYTFFLATAVFFTACEKEEVDRIEPSHRAVFNSEMDFQNQVQINGSITFGDNSAGVVSRAWNFPKDAFDIINTNNDTISTSSVVQTIAKTVGTHQISLSQVYYKDAYVGTTLKGKELDTIITIQILDSIKPVMTANFLNPDGSLGDALNLEDEALNEVEAGNIIRYSYTVTGEPKEIAYDVDGASIEVEDTENQYADIKYKSLGNYDFLFEASRARPAGYGAVNIKNFIKVIKSSQPVTLDKQTTVDGLVRLDFSRDMDAASIRTEQFSVRIKNGDYSATPNITKISVDTNENNVLVIEADETIYDNDTIYVGYTAGTLATSDGVFSEDITDAEAIVDLSGKPNLLEGSSYDYTFETSTADNWVYLWWGGTWEKYTSEISRDMAHSGDKSFKLSMEANGGAIFGHQVASDFGNYYTFDVEEGKSYQIGVWSYANNVGSTPEANNQPDLRFYTSTQTDWSISAAHTYGSDYTTGEWVYGTSTQTFSETGATSFMIRGFNEFNPEAIDIYIDDISVKEINLRP